MLIWRAPMQCNAMHWITSFLRSKMDSQALDISRNSRTSTTRSTQTLASTSYYCGHSVLPTGGSPLPPCPSRSLPSHTPSLQCSGSTVSSKKKKT